jgi:NADH:ubiquinone oxidoreductase subunit F (NADH-binding)
VKPVLTQAPPHGGHAVPAGESGLPRLLPRPGPAGAQAGGSAGHDLAAHLRRHGLPRYRGASLIEQAEIAGLTGRGGAAFPAGRKLRAVASSGRVPVVVANGAEGEPASSKDAALLWYAPHLVLDGLQLAAQAVGADTACVYVHAPAGGPDLTGHLQQALTERHAAGTEQISTRILAAPPRFLAGQETALVARINGAAARPAYQKHRVFERGVGGRPTLVSNVETLAHLALIARHGATWFASVGTATEPGSMLCTVRGPDGRARIIEAALGTPLARLLPLDDGVQAVLTGGYHGGWLTAAAARELTLSNASLQPAGAIVGAGVLVALPVACCGLIEAGNVARAMALESAGQCGPCLNGLPAIAAALTEIARPRPAPGHLANLRRWTGMVTGRGACHHPDGTVRFVASALEVFSAELDMHARGQCTATRSDAFLPLPVPAQSEADWR